MSDGDTLLSAIFADPDADLPRLMYADWLEEFGNDSDRAPRRNSFVCASRTGPRFNGG